MNIFNLFGLIKQGNDQNWTRQQIWLELMFTFTLSVGSIHDCGHLKFSAFSSFKNHKNVIFTKISIAQNKFKPAKNSSVGLHSSVERRIPVKHDNLNLNCLLCKWKFPVCNSLEH